MARRIYGRSRHRKDLILGGLPYADWIKTVNGISPLWDFQELTGSVAAAWNTRLTLGRNIASQLYADYTPTGLEWSNPSGQIARCDGTQVGNTELTDTLSTSLEGKTVQITYTISNYSAGSMLVKLGTAAPSRSADGTYVEKFTVGSNFPLILIFRGDLNFAGDINIETVEVQQTDILPSSSYPTPGTNPLDGDHTAVTVGVPAAGNLGLAVRYPGGTSWTDLLLDATHNSITDPNLFSAFLYALPTWDANERDFLSYTIDANNWIRIGTTAASGVLRWEIRANGTTFSRTLDTSNYAKYMQLGLSSNGSVMKAIYNGAQVGADITLTETVIGNYDTMVIGARDDTPTFTAVADITRPTEANIALDASFWADDYSRSGVA